MIITELVQLVRKLHVHYNSTYHALFFVGVYLLQILF